MIVLAGRGLGRSFGERKVVDGVDIEVSAGEVVGLLGPNGAGKTTAFRILAGVISPDVGTVELGGEDVTRLGLAARARRGLGYLAQESTVFRALTARQNVLAYLEAAGATRAGRDREHEAESLLRRVGLDALADAPAGTLSGGERRRLEVARTLALRPKVLLCDEPFTGVDPLAATELAGVLAHLAHGGGVGVLLCDHAAQIALAVCDRVTVMIEGRIVAAGAPDEVCEAEVVRGAYLGPRAVAIIQPGTAVGVGSRSEGRG